MKLIKAYIRTYVAYDVILALESAGAPRISAIDIRERGDEVDPEQVELSPEVGAYTAMTKLELVVPDERVDAFVNRIAEIARTGSSGRPGDGWIVVSPVESIRLVGPEYLSGG